MILPEIEMSDPVHGTETNSCSKFRNCNASTKKRARDMAIGRMPWPAFVYDQYDVQKTMLKLKEFLNIGLYFFKKKKKCDFIYLLLLLSEIFGFDLVALSFWCARNVGLCMDDRIQLFINNSVTSRMMIIGQSLKSVNMFFFICELFF